LEIERGSRYLGDCVEVVVMWTGPGCEGGGERAKGWGWAVLEHCMYRAPDLTHSLAVSHC
jgi:hypothetical protein